MSAARRWLKQLLCRHLDMEIDLKVDGPSQGWWWRCKRCEKKAGWDVDFN